MKKNLIFAEERKRQILLLLEQQEKLLVPDLCMRFQVSPSTIRNDLKELAQAGKLKRTHGGAISASQATYEPTYKEKENKNRSLKSEIARLALEYIKDGDTIALDTGTTTMELAKLLGKKKKLTVLLNDLNIALYLGQNTDCNVIVLGGNLRASHGCTVGSITTELLATLNIDTAFLATNSFSFENGFTTPDLTQAAVKRQLIRSSQKRIILCDSTKLNSSCLARFADLSDFQVFISDSGMPETTRESLLTAAPGLELCLP